MGSKRDDWNLVGLASLPIGLLLGDGAWLGFIAAWGLMGIQIEEEPELSSNGKLIVQDFWDCTLKAEEYQLSNLQVVTMLRKFVNRHGGVLEQIPIMAEFIEDSPKGQRIVDGIVAVIVKMRFPDLPYSLEVKLHPE